MDEAQNVRFLHVSSALIAFNCVGWSGRRGAGGIFERVSHRLVLARPRSDAVKYFAWDGAKNVRLRADRGIG